jgi:hypothetical protein
LRGRAGQSGISPATMHAAEGREVGGTARLRGRAGQSGISPATMHAAEGREVGGTARLWGRAPASPPPDPAFRSHRSCLRRRSVSQISEMICARLLAYSSALTAPDLCNASRSCSR